MIGQVAWVVGGAGAIGRGLCRGLLKAGATVVVNSSSKTHLEQLSRDLGNPHSLIAIHGSMRPESAEATVEKALEATNSQLHHVMAHSGVRWWVPQKQATPDCEDAALQGPRDCEEAALSGGKGLSQDPIRFSERASMLPALHYAAAKLLLPHLQKTPGSSYTFVTGGAGEQNSIEAQVNAFGVWGLAAALREQYAGSSVRVAEVRVALKIDRPARERALDPRARPLTADLGELCAGLAASSSQDSVGLHTIDSMEHVLRLWAKFPCPPAVAVSQPLWHWQQAQ